MNKELLAARVRGLVVFLRRLAADALYELLTALALFLWIGIQYLGFSLDWFDVGVALFTAAATELLFANYRFILRRGPPKLFFPASAIVAGLGISIFFRALDPAYFALAAFLAIASKYLIRVDGRHIFNPSNFGITTLALLAPFAVTIEFTQWGGGPYLDVFIAAVCFVIAYRAGVLTATLSFLASYTVLLIPLVSLDPAVYSAHHYGLLGPTLVLFACFMITDPKTAPSGNWPRILHGISVAFVYFALEIWGIRYALFLASFLITIFNAVVGKTAHPALTRVAPRLGGVKNILTAILVCCIFFTLAFATFGHDVPAISARDISLSFVLFGVESDGVRSCSAAPVFVRDAKSGVEGNGAAQTYGAAWGDYNGDGFDDLFVSNVSGQPSTLYRNNGDGTFTDVTTATGLPAMQSSSAAFVDLDNDGKTELVVAVLGSGSVASSSRPEVFTYDARSDTFTDSTKKFGLSGVTPALGPAFMSFADYDGDGRLDFVFASSGALFNPVDTVERAFIKSARDPFYAGRKSEYLACGVSEVSSLFAEFPGMYTQSQMAYAKKILLPLGTSLGGSPCLQFSSDLNILPDAPAGATAFDSILTRVLLIPGEVYLFQNTPRGFVEHQDFTSMVLAIQNQNFVKQEVYNQPFPYTSGRYFQPVSFDYNGDGRSDIFIATGFGSDTLLKNQGNFAFSDETQSAHVDYYATGMGVDILDWNGDGRPDILVTNVAQDYLFENQGDGTFINRFKDMPFAPDKIGWGVASLDYDGDGWDDVVMTNGITSEYADDFSNVSSLVRPLFRTDTIYKNEGGTGFADETGAALCPLPENGKALAVSDYSRSGSPGFFVGTVGSGNTLWENTRNDTHYLTVALRGTTSNEMGVGSALAVTSGGHTQTKFLTIGSSFGSENSSRITFGLGTSTGPVLLQINWPSGKRTEQTVLSVDREITVTEP